MCPAVIAMTERCTGMEWKGNDTKRNGMGWDGNRDAEA